VDRERYVAERCVRWCSRDCNLSVEWPSARSRARQVASAFHPKRTLEEEPPIGAAHPVFSKMERNDALHAPIALRLEGES
jgi:hypothetical protein